MISKTFNVLILEQQYGKFTEIINAYIYIYNLNKRYYLLKANWLLCV